MGCPCNANKAKSFVYTYPDGVVDPQTGESTRTYRTEIEAKAAKIRWGGGSWKAVTAQ